jgi:hypothetical protein
MDNDALNPSKETLALVREALSKGINTDTPEGLRKNILISTGLTAYDLQAPAKNLYPVITPLRNSVPRVGRPNPGDAARWRTISSITGSGYDSMAWVPEGQRAGSMSYSATPNTAPYMTIGEEDTISFEAEAAAAGFEDVNATASLRVLQKTMLKEETAILGGNFSLQLGTPVAPTLSAGGTTGTLPALTYSVIVVCLTLEGWRNSGSLNGTVTAGAAVATQKTITGNDGNTFILNGGCSNKSPSATQAITLGQILSASLATITAGTVAFAWYVGAVGSETLQAITTINSATFSAPLVAGAQTAASVAGDYSTNSLAFNGFLSVAMNPANSAYYKTLATGTAGTGTPLTASGRGSVVEIDQMLQTMWDSYRLSPDVIYVNSQEMRNITNKVLTNSSGPLVRYGVDQSAAGGDQGPYQGIHASGAVRWYYNPFSVDGGFDIPIRIHPFLPPGTILAYASKLPPWYQNNEVANPVEIMTRRDYYRIDWPLRTRRREFGVYAEETMGVYAPFAVAVLNNICNG